MISLYKTLLAVHIIAVISWMAGILYLYRLLVYHASETEAVVKERFILMERCLYRIITLPAMLVAFILGLVLVSLNPALLREGWLHAKILLVILLIGITHMAGAFMKKLERGAPTPSPKTFRLLNEVPTLLMIVIVFLVILRPF